MFVFAVYHAFRHVVFGTYCDNKVRTNPTSYQETVFATFGTIHGYNTKKTKIWLLLLYLWSGSRGSDAVIAVHVWYVQEVRVPYMVSARIIINEAAKQAKLSDNAYWCNIPPSTYVCVYRYWASCHQRRHPGCYLFIFPRIFENRVSSIILLQSSSSVNKKAVVRTYYIRTVVTYIGIPGKYQATLLLHHTTCTCTRYLSL